MKTLRTNTTNANNSWNGNKGKLKQIFAWVTGYDIIFAGSRKDLKQDEHIFLNSVK